MMKHQTGSISCSSWLVLFFLLVNLCLAEADVTIPAPMEGEVIETDLAMICIFAEGIKSDSLTVTLDNRDITKDLTEENNFYTYSLKGSIQGKHFSS